MAEGNVVVVEEGVCRKWKERNGKGGGWRRGTSDARDVRTGEILRKMCDKFQLYLYQKRYVCLPIHISDSIPVEV